MKTNTKSVFNKTYNSTLILEDLMNNIDGLNSKETIENEFSDLDQLEREIKFIDSANLKKEFQIIAENLSLLRDLIPALNSNDGSSGNKYKSFGVQVYKITPDFLEKLQPFHEKSQSNYLKKFLEERTNQKNNTNGFNYAIIISIDKGNSKIFNNNILNSAFNQSSTNQNNKNRIQEYCKLKSDISTPINPEENNKLCELIKHSGREITNNRVSLIYENGVYLDESNINSHYKVKQLSNHIKNVFFNILLRLAHEAFEFPDRIIAFAQEDKIKKIMNSSLQAEKACRESIIKHIDFNNIENIFGIFKKFKIYKTNIPELQQVSIIDGKKYPGFFCVNGDFHKEYFVVYPSYKTTGLKAKKLDPQKYLKRLSKIEEHEKKEGFKEKDNLKFDKAAITNKKEIAESLILIIENAIKDIKNTFLLN